MIRKKYPEVITIYESPTYELRGEELYESYVDYRRYHRSYRRNFFAA